MTRSDAPLMNPEALAKMRERLSEFGCPGFDASTCLGLVEALEEAREALCALANRLDEIDAHPGYHAMISMYHVHGGRYDGPSWAEPLEAARAALTQSTAKGEGE